MIKIYHNPRCKKSCAGLAYLQEKTSNFTIIKYMEKGITADEIRDILYKSGKRPIDLVRTQEELYKKELKNKNLSDEEWIDILSKNPRLLQRPILVTEEKAIIGQPVTEIDKIL
ncbi:MAG: arsenate reductase family protein [Bacteroidales bacterium]|nr:arsenate reductase family protein [Bacteroidales bacterium]HOK97748.1 arsenate reductase family protein [Bacteroidales bacterium]HPO64756.1 arsenate reductase family protein [Bacteroidales bacterium]